MNVCLPGFASYCDVRLWNEACLKGAAFTAAILECLHLAGHAGQSHSPHLRKAAMQAQGPACRRRPARLSLARMKAVSNRLTGARGCPQTEAVTVSLRRNK